MINRRRVGQLQRELTFNDFVELEYIENTGTAYIDTSYNSTDWSFDTTISFDVIRNSYLFGVKQSSNERYLNFVRFSSNGKISTSRHMTTTTYNDYLFAVNKKYRLKGSTAELTVEYNDVDEETQHEIVKSFTLTNNGKALSNSRHVLIFTVPYEIDANRNLKGKLYGFKMYNSANTLIRDYVPVMRKYTGECGLWDKVEGKFYTSPNKVRFVGGPVKVSGG